MTTDRPAAYMVCVAYATLVILTLPSSSYGPMLGGAGFLCLAVLAVSKAKPAGSVHPGTIMAVSLLGVVVLVLPNLASMGGRQNVEALPLAFLGSQAVVLLWIASFWEPWREPPRRASLTTCVAIGLSGAGLLSVIATIPIALAVLSGETNLPLLWVYPAYFAGGAGAAAAYYALQGLLHRPVARYLLGVLGGMCFYGAIAPVVRLVDDEPMVLSEMIGIAAVCALFVGPPVALGLIEEPTSRTL